jgi:hypothetical protein
MKLKNILWAMALVAAVGCTSSSDDTEPTPKPTPTPPVEESNLQKHAKDDEIKVMSFNIRLNTSDDMNNAWPFRQEACIELIKDHKPTVIGFQEAKYLDQWLVLLSSLSDGYDGWGVDRDNGAENPKNGETMGILYDKKKVKKIDGGTFWLSTTPDEVSKSWDSACNRTATWGIFEHIATSEKFCYINTHLHLIEPISYHLPCNSILKMRFSSVSNYSISLSFNITVEICFIYSLSNSLFDFLSQD